MEYKKYNSVDMCIYCGQTADKLSDEHIIAEGLGGKLILPKSSCKTCADITSQLELHCLRNIFEPARSHLKIRSKNNRKRVRTLLSKVKGKWDTHSSEITYPNSLTLPTFPPPSAIWDEFGIDQQLQVTGISGLLFKGFNQKFGPESPAKVTEIAVKIDPFVFCRMLAKIAHSYAVAELGPKSFLEYLPKVILGLDSRIPVFVGSGLPLTDNTQDQHNLNLKYINNLIVVGITLFANPGGAGNKSVYDIVVGSKKPS